MSTPIQQSLPFEEPVRPDRPNQLGQAAVEYALVRDILTRASGFMGEYDYTLNPYSGCSFGCTYCYAAFFSMSREKRDKWGHWITVKENRCRQDGTFQALNRWKVDLYEQCDRSLPTH